MTSRRTWSGLGKVRENADKLLLTNTHHTHPVMDLFNRPDTDKSLRTPDHPTSMLFFLTLSPRRGGWGNRSGTGWSRVHKLFSLYCRVDANKNMRSLLPLRDGEREKECVRWWQCGKCRKDAHFCLGFCRKAVVSARRPPTVTEACTDFWEKGHQYAVTFLLKDSHIQLITVNHAVHRVCPFTRI